MRSFDIEFKTNVENPDCWFFWFQMNFASTPKMKYIACNNKANNIIKKGKRNDYIHILYRSCLISKRCSVEQIFIYFVLYTNIYKFLATSKYPVHFCRL